MIIRDTLGLPLNLSTRGLSEPKAQKDTPSRLPLSELRRALKENTATTVLIDFGGVRLRVGFSPPYKKSSYQTGRIGCRTIPASEWKKMVAFIKTTKKAKAAKAGA